MPLRGRTHYPLRSENGKDWHGYCFQRVVVLDEFDPATWDITRLLRYFSRSAMLVPCSGYPRSMPLCADVWIINCEFPPETWLSVSSGRWDEFNFNTLLDRIKSDGIVLRPDEEGTLYTILRRN